MKGFTLIEILAAIVILGVVLLISVPTINGIIGAVSKNAFEVSVNMMLKSANFEVMTKNSLFKSGGIITYVDGEAVGLDLPYTGKRPESGVINIDPEGNVELALFNGEYCVRKSYISSNLSTFKSTKEECSIEGLPMFTKMVSGQNYSLLLDDKNNLYYNYELGTINPLTDEILSAGGEITDYYTSKYASLIGQILSLGEYPKPTDIDSLYALSDSTFFRNVVYHLYVFNINLFLSDISDGTIDLQTFYSTIPAAESKYLSDSKLQKFYSDMKSSFKLFYNHPATTLGISDFMQAVYNSSGNPIENAQYFIEFLQDELPVISYLAYLDNTGLIGIDYIYYISKKVSSEIEADILSVSENSSYIQILMDSFYELTDRELIIPKNIDRKVSQTYRILNKILYINQPQTQLAVEDILNGSIFKNAVYYMYTYSEMFWYYYGQSTQGVIDNAYLTNTELASYYDEMKIIATDIAIRNNSVISLADILEFEFYSDFEYYYNELGGLFQNFIDDNYIKNIIVAAFNASDDAWHAYSLFEDYDVNDFYQSNSTNQLFLTFLADIENEINSRINFVTPKNPEELLSLKMQTISTDAATYFYSLNDVRTELDLKNIISTNKFLAQVHYIFNNEVITNELDDINNIDESVLENESFKTYFNLFKSNLLGKIKFSIKESLTIKSGYSDIKDFSVSFDNIFLLHIDGSISVLGNYEYTSQRFFEKIDGVSDVKEIVASPNTRVVYLIRNDGQVYVYGDNESNKLGLGEGIYAENFTLIPNLNSVLKIIYDYNRESTFAVMTDGLVKMWGVFGRDVNYDDVIIYTPQTVPYLENVRSMEYVFSEQSFPTWFVVHNNNQLSSFTRRNGYECMDPYTGLFTYFNNYSSNIVYGNSNIKFVSNEFAIIVEDKYAPQTSQLYSYYYGIVAKATDGKYYGYGLNTNAIKPGPFSTEYIMWDFTDLNLDNVSKLYVNRDFALYIDNSYNLYYVGDNNFEKYGIKSNYIDYDDNSYILDFTKVENIQVKDLNVVKSIFSSSCDGETHVLLTPSNIVKRYSYHFCGIKR